MEVCPERQRGETVNLLAQAFVGSSPTASISFNPKTHTMKNKKMKYQVGNRIFKTYSTAVEYASLKNLTIKPLS